MAVVYNLSATGPGGWNSAYHLNQLPPAWLVSCEIVVLFDQANASVQAMLAQHQQSSINLTYSVEGNSTTPVAWAEITDTWLTTAVQGNSTIPIQNEATWIASLGNQTISGPVFSHQPYVVFDRQQSLERTAFPTLDSVRCSKISRH